jgi:DNA polymerase-3 subunit alpha
MAAVLSRNLSNIVEITKFMDECRRMGINVLGPDINESYHKFTVNAKGDIRFGLAAIKNVGAGAVENIISIRNAGGQYKDIYDFVERVNLTSVNKRSIESLAMAGAFDNLNIKREQLAAVNAKGEPVLDMLIRYGGKVQADTMLNVNSLFMGDNAIQVAKPEIPTVENWSRIDILKKEKELIGMFLSSHPLDDYKFEMENLVSHSISALSDLATLRNRDFTLGGFVTTTHNSVSKNGKPWGSFTLEDYTGTYDFKLFGKDYETFLKFMQTGYFLLIKATVQERFNNQNELEVKIKQINLLGNAKDNLKCFTVNVPVYEVSPFFAEEMSNIVKSNTGKIEFRVRFVDDKKSISVDLFSRKYRIGITPEMLNFLKSNGLKYFVS